MKNVYKILLVFLLLIFGAVAYFKIQEIRRARIAISVNELAKSEFNSIVISGELAELREEEQTPQCHHDYKLGRLRCNVRYVKYFRTSNESCHEFEAVKGYLLKALWKLNYSEEECGRMKALGYMPYANLNNAQKNPPYPLELHLRFYNEEDLRESCESYVNTQQDKNLCGLSNVLLDGDSIYTISITSDFVD